MTGNLGKMEITEVNIFTAELPFLNRTVKITSGIKYPVGAVIVYDETTQRFKPCDMKTSTGLVLVVNREVLQTEEFAFCGVFGAVKKEKLVKADNETTFTEWVNYTNEDLVYLLQNSKLM